MIKKLSLTELIEAAVSLDKASQAQLLAALAGPPDSPQKAATNQPPVEPSGQWASLAYEGLARAYGDNEPTYSDADLVP